MKKAFSYLRISTKDQSNFSIDAQKEANQKYAKENGVIILESFVDDGVSAKNFDRPSWKELYGQLKKLRKEIDYLLVAKYDRLVRNAADGLAMLRKIEEEYGIKVISTTECFFIDPHSPVFFKFRADLFVNAEFEYRVIRDRTKMGNWQAKMSGRYITTAPLGYDNARDDKNKPIIVQNEHAWKVKKAFKMYLAG
jgi:DNA invertase Pin-like site-specific DNA recombinase